jgi:Leucine-rich repeat (LRR) protein
LNDAKLKNLEGLTAVVGLDLSDTQISDAGLASLKGLTTLEYLQLAQTDVGDKGMEQLVDLVNLELLDLTYTRVTQDCATHLERLPKLKKVYACGTKLSHIQGVEVDYTHHISGTWTKERPK